MSSEVKECVLNHSARGWTWKVPRALTILGWLMWTLIPPQMLVGKHAKEC